MNPALRKSVVLLIGLSAVFPCGMAFTALAALVLGAGRAWQAGSLDMRAVPAILIYALWSLGGLFGFISLVHGADTLLVSRQRLVWWEFLGMLVAIVTAGVFALSWINHPASGVFLKATYIAPSVVGSALLVLHFYYLFHARPRS